MPASPPLTNDTPLVRIGLGTDLHRLEPGRRLVLAGVRIPAPAGPAAHSDGDVVLHALVDALLGAIAAGDIGEHFPDHDPKLAGADSRIFVSTALTHITSKGLRPAQVDVVIHCQQPKLSPHKPALRESLAELLGLPLGRCSVKAKTNEGVDAVGEGRAIAATVVVGLALAS